MMDVMMMMGRVEVRAMLAARDCAKAGKLMEALWLIRH